MVVDGECTEEGPVITSLLLDHGLADSNDKTVKTSKTLKTCCAHTTMHLNTIQRMVEQLL